MKEILVEKATNERRPVVVVALARKVIKEVPHVGAVHLTARRARHPCSVCLSVCLVARTREPTTSTGGDDDDRPAFIRRLFY